MGEALDNGVHVARVSLICETTEAERVGVFFKGVFLEDDVKWINDDIGHWNIGLMPRPIEILVYQFLSTGGCSPKYISLYLLKEADTQSNTETENDLIEDIHVGNTENGEHHSSEKYEHNEVDDERCFASVLGEVLAFQVVNTDDEGEKNERFDDIRGE